MTEPTPPGWYPDPWQPGTVRWFDGANWTQHAAPAAPAPSGFSWGDRYDAEKGANTARWAGYAFLARSVATSIQLIATPIVFGRFFDEFRDALDDPENADQFQTFDMPWFSGVAQIAGLFVWLCLAGICVWTFRATKNAQLLGMKTTFSPALAVGGWLIPFANFVMPYIAVRDLFPEGHRGRRDAGIWWGIEIAGVVMGVVALVVGLFGGSGAGVVLGVVAAALAITAGVLGWRLVHAVVAAHADIARATGQA